jgi:hypothetical protein
LIDLSDLLEDPTRLGVGLASVVVLDDPDMTMLSEIHEQADAARRLLYELRHDRPASATSTPPWRRCRRAYRCVVVGRGFHHATAFEWALKLQELTYLLAQPHSAVDFLHGPLAVIEPGSRC